jgi:V8-like Glu-specific endopeptidase
MTTKNVCNRATGKARELYSLQPLRRTAVFALGLLVACGPTESGSDGTAEIGSVAPKITAGTKTSGYPSVGYLTSGGVSCTATLIGRREVLTAAHCIDSQSGRFSVGGSNRPWSTAHVHEAYDKNTLDNDLAVVILDSAVTGVEPSSLGTAAVAGGQTITLVGYGYTSFSGGNSASEKYVGTNQVASVGSKWFSYRGGSNNCSGDSGGPSFAGAVVVGVHSSGEGNAYCSTTGYDVRVDPYVSWIESKATGDLGGGGDASCADKTNFVDAHGFRCSDWVGYDCTAAEQWNYTQAQENDLIANCRATCNQCGGGGQTCADLSGYRDAQGYSCSDWSGFDCSRAAEDYGYTTAQEASIVANCKLSCGTCPAGGGTGGGTATKLNKHVFVVAMENHDATGIYGSSLAPYINGTLMTKYARAARFGDVLPNEWSEPHYVWMEAGTNSFSDHGFHTDDDPSSSNSTGSTAHLTTQIKNASNGVSWMSYQEGLNSTTGACPVVSSGFYAAKHNPFVFFRDVVGSTPSKTSSYCAAHHKSLTSLAGDLANGTVASYNFVTPNLCNDMHGQSGCPSGNVITMGDNWVRNNFPAMIDYVNKNGGVIFLTWDEGQSSNTLPFLAIGPTVKGGYVSSVSYDHSSLVKSIERILGLPILSSVANATELTDMFVSGGYPN